MNNNKSVPILDRIEFINLQPLDISPTISKCDIKVFYVGQNRNGSAITREVGMDMATRLRGVPLCGWWRSEKDDFGDHGHKITIVGGEFKEECITVPLGFVPTDAKVWYQMFTDTDEFGNSVEREYLMTTGYLWTKQFNEAKEIINNGKGQSMELDPDTVSGHCATDNLSGGEFFMIEHADITKLVALGDDVEPCFEGASITEPEISTTFAKVDDSFNNTLLTMMRDLTFALQGGRNMDENLTNEVESPVVEPEAPAAVLDNSVETATVENEVPTEDVTTPEFAEEEKKDEEKYGESKDESKDNEDENKDEKDKDHKYSLLQAEFDELNAKFSALETECESLRAFKADIEDKEKDAYINKFTMLSDEDKADVIKNKSSYSLDEIKAKLSIIYTEKQMAVEQAEIQTATSTSENPVVTFSLNGDVAATKVVPDWVLAVRENEANN